MRRLIATISNIFVDKQSKCTDALFEKIRKVRTGEDVDKAWDELNRLRNIHGNNSKIFSLERFLIEMEGVI